MLKITSFTDSIFQLKLPPLILEDPGVPFNPLYTGYEPLILYILQLLILA